MLVITVIVIISLTVLKLLSLALARLPRLPEPIPKHLQSVVRWVIFLVALWRVLSNRLCTLMLIMRRPFRIGDHIEIIDPAMTAGLSGRVRNINPIFTTLDGPGSEQNETLHIPNNLFFQKILKKISGQHTHSLDQQIFKEKSLLGAARKKDDTSKTP